MNAERSARSLRESGEGSSRHGVAVDDVRVGRGALAGERVLLADVPGGASFEVLVSRGLDIGRLRCGGQEMAWRSRERGAAGAASGSWFDRWTGGMVTTCGLENVGAARDGLPLHGSHHSTPSRDVTWRTEAVGGEQRLTIEGTVPAVGALGHRLELHRTITATTGRAGIALRDRVVNVDHALDHLSLLYHVNFGAPFLAEGTEIEVEGGDVVDESGAEARARAGRFTSADGDDAEWVEHVVPTSAEAVARIRSPHGGSATVRWSRATLPRLFQWWWPAAEEFVLAIEPSTSPLFPAQRRSAELDGLAVPPGGEVVFTLSVEVG